MTDTLKKPETPTQEDMAKMMDPKIGDIIKVAVKLAQIKWNVVLFSNTPWLLIQFYVGLYLGKKTILLINENEKHFAKRLKHPLLKHVVVIKKPEDAQKKEVVDMINKIIQSYEAKEK